MLRGWADTRSRPFTLLLGLVAAAFVLGIIAYPEQAFESSLSGLTLWWELVFPALLPFMVVSELFFGFGMARGLGALLEPAMRLFFRVPGAGGWALAMGLAAGYPLGADVTAKLRRQGLIGSGESQRLLAVSHLANPMVIVGVVGAGFLRSPGAGLALAVLHYGAAFLAGVFLRGRSSSSSRKPLSIGIRPVPAGGRHASLFGSAFRSMEQAKAEDGRTFGKLLGDAVASSVQTLMLLGGMIMLFSVGLRIALLPVPDGAAGELLARLVPGLAEPHLGAYAYARHSGMLPTLQGACIAAVLAWSGFSVHAQVLGLASGTDLRYKPFFFSRLLHSGLSFAAGLAFWQPLNRLFAAAAPVFSPAGTDLTPPLGGLADWGFRSVAAVWGSLFVLLALFLCLMLLLSLCIRVLERTVSKRPR